MTKDNSVSGYQLHVVEDGQPMAFTYKECLHYHGFLLPGGAAHGFQSLAFAVKQLSPAVAPERREIHIETSFPGRGARDAIEMVTRSLTEGRYVVNPDLAKPERGHIASYVFQFSYRGRTVAVQVKEGLVLEEFRQLVDKGSARTAEEEKRIVFLRKEMGDRLATLAPEDVYEVV